MLTWYYAPVQALCGFSVWAEVGRGMGMGFQARLRYRTR